jgi:uncharacterized protein DUF6624
MPLVWSKELCDELSRRVERDQQARHALLPFFARSTNGMLTGLDPNEKTAMDALSQVDRDNTAWLKGLVEDLGWPLRYEVGDECGFNAWLLVQHADQDVEFQHRCLDLMRRAPEDAVDPSNFAYLYDRVMLAGGHPQLYGTQVERVDGTFRPCSLADPEDVDSRRLAAGLEPSPPTLKDSGR